MLEAGLRAGQQGWPGARQGRAMGAPGAGICEARALVLLALLCLGVRNSKKEPPLAPASTSSPGPRFFSERTAVLSQKNRHPGSFRGSFRPVLLFGSFMRFFFLFFGAVRQKN